MTVKFRYKKPDEKNSNLIVHPIKDIVSDETSNNFKFSAAVAGFGMILFDSEFKQNLNYDMVNDLAKAGKGNDENGYRAEFISLVKASELLNGVANK